MSWKYSLEQLDWQTGTADPDPLLQGGRLINSADGRVGRDSWAIEVNVNKPPAFCRNEKHLCMPFSIPGFT